jgi:hypothetical protein
MKKDKGAEAMRSPTKKYEVNVKVGQIRNVVVSALIIILVIGLVTFLVYYANLLMFKLAVLTLLGE